MIDPTSQFLRACSFELGNKIYEYDGATEEGLRLTFDIERDQKNVPNNAEFKLYNLSDDEIGEIEQAQELTARLTAGYVNNTKQIFFGTVRDAFATYDGVDKVLTVSCGDAEKQFVQTVISKTWPQGTLGPAVLADIIKACNIKTGNSKALPVLFGGSPMLAAPLMLAGGAFDALDRFCRGTGITWSIQNGEFQGAVLGLPVVPMPVLVSPDTGLIGDPSVNPKVEDKKTKKKKTVVTFTSLLNGDIYPGTVSLLADNPKYSGPLKIISTHYTGDTHGEDWHQESDGEPI